MAEEGMGTATEAAVADSVDSPLDSPEERMAVEERVLVRPAADGLEARLVVAGSEGTREEGTPVATLQRSRRKGLE